MYFSHFPVITHPQQTNERTNMYVYHAGIANTFSFFHYSLHWLSLAVCVGVCVFERLNFLSSKQIKFIGAFINLSGN